MGLSRHRPTSDLCRPSGVKRMQAGSAATFVDLNSATVRNLSNGNPCGSLSLLAHHIAASPDCLDIVLAAGCTGELFPQFANEDVDDLHFWLVHTAVEVAQE